MPFFSLVGVLSVSGSCVRLASRGPERRARSGQPPLHYTRAPDLAPAGPLAQCDLITPATDQARPVYGCADGTLLASDCSTTHGECSCEGAVQEGATHAEEVG